MSQDDTDNVTQQIIQQVIRTVTPELLSASQRIAEEVSKSTLVEIESWRNLQETRRKRDNAHFSFDGNKEQHLHASNVLSVFEATEQHLTRKQWDKAKEAIVQGKQLIIDRIKTIRMADTTDWGTVKEFHSGASLGLSDNEEKRWKEAIKTRAHKAPKRERMSDDYVGPSTSSSASSPRVTRTPQSKRKPMICFKCHKSGHLSYDCWRKDRY